MVVLTYPFYSKSILSYSTHIVKKLDIADIKIPFHLFSLTIACVKTCTGGSSHTVTRAYIKLKYTSV